MGRKKTNSKAVSYDENRQTDSEESDNEVFISERTQNTQADGTEVVPSDSGQPTGTQPIEMGQTATTLLQQHDDESQNNLQHAAGASTENTQHLASQCNPYEQPRPTYSRSCDSAPHSFQSFRPNQMQSQTTDYMQNPYLHTDTGMQNTLSGFSNALNNVQRQQADMHLRHETISGALNNVLSMLQTLTENSQNSSQNNCSSSTALEGSGPSTNGPLSTDVRGQLTNTNNEAETALDQPATQTGFEDYNPTDYIRTGERVGNNLPFLNTANYHSYSDAFTPHNTVNERDGRCTLPDSRNRVRYPNAPVWPQNSVRPYVPGHTYNRDTRDSSRGNIHQRPHFERQARPDYSEVKLPPFNGKEEWKIWINRFEAVAERRNWNEEKKLDNLLPKLQGKAGDFVFSQLSHSTLASYRELIKELNSRFRVVETRKTFAAQFSQRTQKHGETAEEFAADLKRLYAKAYRSRDSKTRQEDLVRRFLDGLRDNDARFEIEYNKEPEDIDEAVYHAVNFMQTKHRSASEAPTDRKFKRYARRMSEDSESSGDEQVSDAEVENDHALRVPVKAEQVQKKKSFRPSTKTDQSETTPETQSESMKVLTETRGLVQALMNQLIELNKQNTGLQNGRYNPQLSAERGVICYSCKQRGHYARDCPSKRSQPADRGEKRVKLTSQGTSQGQQNGTTSKQHLN